MSYRFRLNPLRGWTGVLAVVAVLASAGPSQAFYWYGWPGSRVPPDRTIVTPPNNNPGNPPDRPPVNPPPVTPPNQSVPEPATALTAIIGLGVVAAARRRRSHQAV